MEKYILQYRNVYIYVDITLYLLTLSQPNKMKENKKPEQQMQKENLHEAKKEDPKDAKINDLTETLQRLQAEFENYKKRADKECLQLRKYAVEDFIKKLLPILDSFEMALKNTNDAEKFRKGVELIFAQLYQTLEQEGLKKIESLSRKFDPYRHEVLLNEKSDKEDDTVLEELQKGYMLHDHVIRTAKVKVSSK